MAAWSTINGARPGLIELALRLLLAAAIVVAVIGSFRREIVEGLLPVFQWIIEAVDGKFNILMLDVTDRKLDQVVRLRVELTHTLFIKARPTYPAAGEWFEVTTTLGTVLQPAMAVLVTVGAWPAARWFEFMVRLVLGTALALVLVVLDTPIDLLAYVWDMFIQRFDPDGFYPIRAYHQFMIGGGRFALGVVVGIVAIATANRWHSYLAKPSPIPSPLSQ